MIYIIHVHIYKCVYIYMYVYIHIHIYTNVHTAVVDVSTTAELSTVQVGKNKYSVLAQLTKVLRNVHVLKCQCHELCVYLCVGVFVCAYLCVNVCECQKSVVKGPC
jgi:hypothetical protein